jgi:predicted transcriptional regulator of viral defense system
MKYKNISFQSARVLGHFGQASQPYFESREAMQALPQSKSSAVRQLLCDMTHRGLLLRVKKGTYHLIPYEQDPDTYLPNWHTLAAALTQGCNHYIGYYSALQIHNLIVQPSLKEQIVVDRQLQTRPTHVNAAQIQYIYHNPKHFFGHKKIWIDDYTQVLCSDLEKTIVDCLFMPSYAGGIPEIARAIHMAQNRIHYGRLLQYVTQFGSQAVIKRLGYLLETLEIDQPIVEALRQARSATYVPLDPELPKSGKYRSHWNIQENLDIGSIKSAIYS